MKMFAFLLNFTNFVPEDPINNKIAFLQTMPLSQPMMAQFAEAYIYSHYASLGLEDFSNKVYYQPNCKHTA